jgi:hypothetical protein
MSDREALGQLVQDHSATKLKIAALRAKAAAWNRSASKASWICHLAELGQRIPAGESGQLMSVDADAIRALLTEYEELRERFENQREILRQAGMETPSR